MPWACRLVDFRKLQMSGEETKPGDMWYAPWMGDYTDLSPQYKRDWKGKRPPLFVKLPNGRVCCVDFRSSEKDKSWTVKGTPPKITVYPSIHSPGTNGYHGLLICGFFSDDMEGRKYQK